MARPEGREESAAKFGKGKDREGSEAEVEYTVKTGALASIVTAQNDVERSRHPYGLFNRPVGQFRRLDKVCRL